MAKQTIADRINGKINPKGDPNKDRLSGDPVAQAKRLLNLKPYDSDTARVMIEKSRVSRMANIAIREAFHLTAKNFLAIQKDLPQISAVDVLQMAVLHALKDDNFEDAARYAGMLAEFQSPKLMRTESVNLNITQNLTDDELRIIIDEEGLVT